MPHAVRDNKEERGVCFRSIYYEVELKCISDDYPEELIDTCGSICRDCSASELEDGGGVNPCITCVHSIVKASGEEWTNRYRRSCYFCMKPLYEERPARDCASCQNEEANYLRRYIPCN